MKPVTVRLVARRDIRGFDIHDPSNHDRTPDVPDACDVCTRTANQLKGILGENGECSHVQCPHRKRITAQPRR